MEENNKGLQTLFVNKEMLQAFLKKKYGYEQPEEGGKENG